MRNCSKRKREFRIHEILSNGQHFNMYFKKHHNATPDGVIHSIWTVGLCVSQTRKKANQWWSHEKKSGLGGVSTGNVGLEALRRAAQYLMEFSYCLSFHSEIQVGWSDDKRKKAYRWLFRYGFVEYEDCYAMRNPDYWVMK